MLGGVDLWRRAERYDATLTGDDPRYTGNVIMIGVDGSTAIWNKAFALTCGKFLIIFSKEYGFILVRRAGLKSFSAAAVDRKIEEWKSEGSTATC